MKIEGLPPPGKGDETPRGKAEKTEGKPFDSFLKESIGAGKTVKKEAQFSVHSIPPVHNPEKPAGNVKSNAIKELETVLSDLEMYRNTLADEEVPLARLSEMSDTLVMKKDALVAMMPHVDDPDIKNLIAHTAALILNENSRYHAS